MSPVPCESVLHEARDREQQPGSITPCSVRQTQTWGLLLTQVCMFV